MVVLNTTPKRVGETPTIVFAASIAKPTKLKESPTQIHADFENQLYSSVRRFIFLSQIFVCAPMGAHKQHIKWDFLQRMLQLMHWIWCFMVFNTVFVCVYHEYTESNVDLPSVQKPLFLSEYLVYVIHIFQITVSIYRARHKFRTFMQSIINFDVALHAFTVYPRYDVLRKFIQAHLVLIVFHFICTCIVNYFYSGRFVVGFMGSIIVYVLPNVILEISLVQYYTLLYAIALRAINLNIVLKSQLSKIRQYEADILQRNLHKIRLLFSKLEIFTAEVNDSFGQSIVLVFIGSFMNITVNIFLLYKYMDNLKKANLALILYSVIWTLMHVGKMFLILYYNHCVQSQKSTTALLLNDIKGQNVDIEETITHFIYQLIIDTRSNVVCGVGALNMDFITSLLVAVSTLFIFLLQYDITFDALTQKRQSASPLKGV